MPIQTTWINQKINEFRIEDNKKKFEAHKSSGKLSAGMLFQPLRFQVLKTIGAKRQPFDAYTLGVFEIGNDVEAKLVASLDRAGVLVRDKAVEKYGLTWNKERDEAKSSYRETIGLIDAVVDTSKMEQDWGVMPWECKSVTSYKYKHINKKGVDWHYKLQAAQNALGMNSDKYGVAVISKEHQDPKVFIFDTKEIKNDVDKIISNYMRAMEEWKNNMILPKFEVDERVKWASNPKYAMFDKFYMEASDQKVIEKLKSEGII